MITVGTHLAQGPVFVRWALLWSIWAKKKTFDFVSMIIHLPYSEKSRLIIDSWVCIVTCSSALLLLLFNGK